MNVAHELQQVGVLLAKDGPVAVLEEMPTPPVPPIERHRIAGQQPPHDGGDRGWPVFSSS